MVALGEEGGGRRRRGKEGGVGGDASCCLKHHLCPSQPVLDSWFLGFWSETLICSQSQESYDHPSCPENLGSRFSYFYFIDGNLRPRVKLMGMANYSNPSSVGSCHHSILPTRLLETPNGQDHQK